MAIAHILVALDLREGLAKSMTLKKAPYVVEQSLDYAGIPFKCLRCHNYGHLAAKCSIPFRKREWVRKSSKIATTKKGNSNEFGQNPKGLEGRKGPFPRLWLKKVAEG